MPDTSPRGASIAGEDETYDFGTGAGFYLNATNGDWAKNYNMYSLCPRLQPPYPSYSVDPQRDKWEFIFRIFIFVCFVNSSSFLFKVEIIPSGFTSSRYAFRLQQFSKQSHGDSNRKNCKMKVKSEIVVGLVVGPLILTQVSGHFIRYGGQLARIILA